MTTAIIDYGSGNLCSAAKAFERAAAESGAAGNIVVTSRPDEATGVGADGSLASTTSSLPCAPGTRGTPARGEARSVT